MKESSREIAYVLILVFVVWMLTKVIWFMPFIVLVPMVIVYTVDSPLVYLFSLALIGELFSFLPPGIVIMVVFIPWVIQRIVRVVQVDVSFAFAAMVVGTCLLQLAVMFIPSAVQAGSVQVVPWLSAGLVVLFSSTVTWLVAIAVYYNRSW